MHAVTQCLWQPDEQTQKTQTDKPTDYYNSWLPTRLELTMPCEAQAKN